MMIRLLLLLVGLICITNALPGFVRNRRDLRGYPSSNYFSDINKILKGSGKYGLGDIQGLFDQMNDLNRDSINRRVRYEQPKAPQKPSSVDWSKVDLKGLGNKDKDTYKQGLEELADLMA